MILSENIEVKITKHNIEHYTNIGYKVNLKDVILVSWKDLPTNSKKELDFKCDYCGVVFVRGYNIWTRSNSKSPINKDACSKCKSKKTEESNLATYGVANIMHVEEHKKSQSNAILEKYGVTSVMKLPDFVKKAQSTNLKKYGGISPAHSKDIMDKIKNTNIERYGVPCAITSEKVRDKIKKTNLERYGFENASSSPLIRKKVEDSFMKKYGVDSVFKSDVVISKIKHTNMQKYGVENVFQSEEIKNKIRNSNIEKYGTPYPSASDDVKEKVINTNLNRYGVKYVTQHHETREKMLKSLYSNGTAPCSRQQSIIHEISGGQLNYPVGRCMLDIAFPIDMIYLEYDGGGHNLQVKLNNMSEFDFNKKEIDRYHFLKRLGWKEIRIISSNDKLHDDIKISDFVFKSKYFLLNNKCSSVRWDMDNDKVSVSYKDYIDYYDFISMDSEEEYFEFINSVAN